MRIISVKVAGAHVVHIEFDDGFEGRVDLSNVIRPDGVTARMADPAVFAAVRIGPHGRTLVWPDEVDFCADALRQRAAPL